MDDEPDTTIGARGAAAPDDSAVVIDARGAVMVWSAGARRLLGYEPEGGTGRPAAPLLAAELPYAMRRHVAARIDMGEGSLLVLYTDGLIEAPGRDIDVGLDLLREALRSPAVDLEGTCDEVLGKVRPELPADDIVLLLARTSKLGADQVRT